MCSLTLYFSSLDLVSSDASYVMLYFNKIMYVVYQQVFPFGPSITIVSKNIMDFKQVSRKSAIFFLDIFNCTGVAVSSFQ